jgi:iron complex outermembrane receptor protein
MKNPLFKLYLSFMLVGMSMPVFAQQKITGTIKDNNGKPIESASVKIAGTKQATISNSNGTFSINGNTGDILEVSSIGFETKKIKITGTNINIQLNTTTTDLQEVILVGSRGAGRVKTESPVPVDVIKLSDVGVNTARMDLTSTLNYVAPSFNYNKQSGADGADHIDIGTLRGLGPDQTLVLINGKRRHSTAFVGLFGTRGRGNSGVDLNGFPQSAVDRIEILRDGASAQYGSDAIAGVMNIVLKKNTGEWNITTGLAGYYDKKYNTVQFKDKKEYLTGNAIDGVTKSLSANRGFEFGKNGGFINLSLDVLDQGKTFRQAASDDISKSDGLPTNTWRRAFGDGSLQTIGIMFNAELPVDEKTKFYAFGGINAKNSDAFAYTRNWSAKPSRFPVNMNGDLFYVPSVMFATGSGDTTYNPHIQTKISDLSFTTGFSGVNQGGWDWDFSNSIGHNNFHYYGDGTFNASNIGNIAQTHFDDGGFNFLQNTSNIDLSKQFGKVNEGGIKLAYGGELRYEQYTIYEGELASYNAYPNNYGLEQAPGSQGFPGFSPADKVDAHRWVGGIYGDVEYTPTKLLLLTGAVRFENYSDFGAVSTFKSSFRYKVTDNFNFRGSFSTGYRAPSLQQKYFSNTLTSFSGGELVQSRIANNDDPLTKLAGIPSLKQETSLNTSLGFSWKPAKGLTFTVDGYNIKMKDRVVLSGLFSASDASLPKTLTSKLNALGVSTAQFFANAVNTTNTGVDVVADYQKKISNKERYKILFVANFQGISIDEIHIPAALNTNEYNANTFFNDREKYFLKASAPKSKFSGSFDYTKNKISIGTRITYFGDLALTGFGINGDGINPQVPADADASGNTLVPEIFNYKGKFTTDIYMNMQMSKTTSLVIGADNIFNVHPDFAVNPKAKWWAGDNETGGPWDGVQMGYNGLRIFTKLAIKF